MLRELLAVILPDGTEKLLMAIGAALGVILHLLFGDVLRDVLYLFLLVAVDYILGNIVAYRKRQWNSHTGFLGITKKSVIFLVVAFCHWADVASGVDVISLRAIAICAYAVNELGSILENIELLGYGDHIPPVIRKAMKVAEERSMGSLSGDVFNGSKKANRRVGYRPGCPDDEGR